MSGTNNWLGYALASALFAALTTILGKIGVAEINSNLATFIRTIVIFVLVAAILTFRSSWQPLNKISQHGFIMLVLSGITTGLSWLCYYRALQLGKASQVAPIDKLSVVFVIIISLLLLGEAITWKVIVGGLLITAGAVILTV